MAVAILKKKTIDDVKALGQRAANSVKSALAVGVLALVVAVIGLIVAVVK